MVYLDEPCYRPLPRALRTLRTWHPWPGECSGAKSQTWRRHCVRPPQPPHALLRGYRPTVEWLLYRSPCDWPLPHPVGRPPVPRTPGGEVGTEVGTLVKTAGGGPPGSRYGPFRYGGKSVSAITRVRQEEKWATGHRNIWLRSTLLEAVRAAALTKGTYLAAQYHRLAARRGTRRAIMALAHTILRTTNNLLSRDQDLGGDYFDEWDSQRERFATVRRIEHLNYQVSLEAA